MTDTNYIPDYMQSLSGEAQPYLPLITPRVPRSIHAKFHADRAKNGLQQGYGWIDKKPDKQTNRPHSPVSIIWIIMIVALHEYESLSVKLFERFVLIKNLIRKFIKSFFTGSSGRSPLEKTRYDTSLGLLTKKFVGLLKNAPDGVSLFFFSVFRA